MSDKKKTLDEKQLKEKAIQGAAAEVIQRYGDAAKQHFVAYSGIDNEQSADSKTLSKSLKSIAQSKVNEDYKRQNLKQQSGFSAEVKSVARKNADNIIAGKSERYARTDDLGRKNDQIIDVESVDLYNNVIPGKGAQIKFVGKDAKELFSKFQSKAYKKYLDADVLLGIPDEDYDELIGTNGKKGIIDNKIDELIKQHPSTVWTIPLPIHIILP